MTGHRIVAGTPRNAHRLKPTLRTWCRFTALFEIGCAASFALGCSSANPRSDQDACAELDLQDPGQATVKAFNEAALALQARADDLEGRYFVLCNTMNGDLGLDVRKTSTGDACAVLRARVAQALGQGALVRWSIVSNCSYDIDAHAPCDDKCQLPAGCDFQNDCKGGVVTPCNGSCTGTCETAAPDLPCSGNCRGTCSAVEDVSCMGICEGACNDPSFDGSCDAGCSADFVGTCQGRCVGTCDALSVDGACGGACSGRCEGTALGTCGAPCALGFKGACAGACTGACSDATGVACTSSCAGSCQSEPVDRAACQGACHGDCAAPTSPPLCQGTLDCPGAECFQACQAKGFASVACPRPAVAVTVVGDSELQRVFTAHATEWGELESLTGALYEPIQSLGGNALSAIQNVGYVLAAEQRCFIATFDAIAESVISINSSNQVSSSVRAP